MPHLKKTHAARHHYSQRMKRRLMPIMPSATESSICARSVFHCLAVLLWVTLAGSAFATPERAKEFLGNANYYIGKGDWPSALIELKNAIQQDPKNPRAWFVAGLVSQHLGDLSSAEQDYKTAAANGYDAAETDAALAEVLVKSDKLEALLDQVKPGSRPSALEARVLSARGYAYIGLKRVVGAQRSFEEALKLDEKNAPARAGLAQVYVGLGKLDEAQSLLERAIADDPTLDGAWLLLGYVHLWKDDRPGARGPFEKAVEIASASEPAHRARALYLAGEDPESARADIDFLLSRYPHHTVGNFLDALIKVRRGQIHEAEVSLQNIDDINGYAPALYLLARINFSQGNFGEATTNINRLLGMEPDSKPALTLRAALLLRTADADKAVPILEGLIVGNDRDPELLEMLADAYSAAHQRDKAEAILDKLASLGGDAQTRFGIALRQNTIGKYEDALGTLEAASAVGPLSTDSISLLVADLLKESRIDEAWRRALVFSQQTNGSAEAQVVLGVVAVRREGAAAAEAYFERALALDPNLATAAVDLASARRLQGKIAEARTVLDQAFTRDQQSFQVILARADLEQSQGDKAAETLWLERARKVAAQATGPRYRLIALYLDARDTADAVAVAKELQQLTPNDPNALAGLGQALLANGEQQSAISAFQQMVAASNDSPAALLVMSRAYLAVTDLANAGATLRKALRAAPDDLGVQTAVVDFAARYGQIDEFIAVAQNAARDHLGDGRIEEIIGALYLEAGRPRDAIAAYSDAITHDPGRRATLGLAQAQATAGDMEAGIATVRAWLSGTPDDIDGHILLARLLAGSGQCAPAIVELEKLVTERPADPLLRNDLAWCYNVTGDTRALKIAEEAHHLAPDLALVQDTLGWIMVQDGDTEDGAKLLTAAAQQADATPGMQYHLAVALDRLGRREEAQQALKAALAKGTSFAEAKDAQLLQVKLGN